MGTPIVDPMWFYWISVIDNVKCVFSVIAIIIGVSLIVITIAIAANCEDLDDIRQGFKKYKCLQIGTFVVCLALMICFMPSSEALIKMEIAKHATYENATIAIEKIEEVAKDIIHELQGDD